MKGISKGLNKITHIFVVKEKEKEIQIGAPTDVKHVAHIGSEGDAAAAPPSWMGGFNNGGPEFSSQAVGTSTPARGDPNGMVGADIPQSSEQGKKKHKRKKIKGHREKKSKTKGSKHADA